MPKKLIITGATGFTGYHILKMAVEKGYAVTALVRNPIKAKFPEAWQITIISLRGDLLNVFQNYLDEFGSPDIFIHNAGLVRGCNEKLMYNSNVKLTEEIIDAIKKSELKPKKFLFTSSLAAVGPGSETGLVPIEEDCIPNPVTIYGKSKLEAEKILKAQSELPWLIIRPTAIYGPGDKDGLSIYRLISKGLSIRLTGKKQQLSFLYVEDFANAIFALAESNYIHKIYFLSDDETYFTRDWLNIIESCMRRKTLKLIIPSFASWLIALLSEIKGENSIISRDKLKELKANNWSVKVEKVKTDLGWTPKIKLKDGVELTYKWYKENGWI